MKKAAIKRLAAEVLEHLRGLPDGTELSTAEAVEQVDTAVLQTLEFEDWFTLHSAIFDKAAAYGLNLDDSEYADQAVGLPHHIPYVVTHKGPLV